MRLTQIRDFLAVVECGGVRAAARKLGVSQPTLSNSVRELEVELHVQLLGRSPRGVVLTRAGRAFHARAQAAATELRKASEEAAQTGGSEAGTVTFSMGPVGVIAVLPEALARFRRQFPRARVNIVEGHGHLMLADLRNGTLDFAFGQKSANTLDAAIRFRPLFRSEQAVCARKGHPLSRAHSLAELAGADWLANGISFAPGDAVEKMFRSAGLEPPQAIVRCVSHTSALSLLAHSDMLTLAQRHILNRSPTRELLQAIEIADPLPSVTVGMYMRADTPPTRVAAAMVRHVTAVSRALGRAAGHAPRP